jgi:hypothetical protein
MNHIVFLLIFFLKLKHSQILTLIALFPFSIFSISLNSVPIDIYAQTSAVINNTTTISPLQSNLSLQEEEKQIVQKDLADMLRKAISIGAEIPEVSGGRPGHPEEDNATLYVKVNVNNTGERIANASDFSFTINYQSNTGTFGVAGIHGSDAGVIVRLPEGSYNIMPQRSETGDPVEDSFINSFGGNSLSGDCFGKIKSGESKECTVTKSISSLNNTSNSITSSSQQESQIIENDTSFQSPLSIGSPSIKPVEGVYTNNQSGIQVTFPQGWNGTEYVYSQGNYVYLYLTPPSSSFLEILSGQLPSIVLQISSLSSKMPQDFLNISSEDLLNPNDFDLSKKMGCKFTTISSENVSINQTAGKELMYQCTPSSNQPITQVVGKGNGKVFAINKGENQIIMAYSSFSAANFEKHLPEFDKAVQSLKIQ